MTRKLTPVVAAVGPSPVSFVSPPPPLSLAGRGDHMAQRGLASVRSANERVGDLGTLKL